MSWSVLCADVLEGLAALRPGSVQATVTSPPYYGLRDYGIPPTRWPDGWVGCLGLEPDPGMYLSHLVEVFRSVRRVMRDDAVLWLNISDTYFSANNGSIGTSGTTEDGIAAKVREWALDHGDDRRLRIVLCGYEGEHEMPEDWHCHSYSATGAYVGKGTKAAKGRHRERIWFSPHCQPVDLHHVATREISGPLFTETP